MPTEPDLDAILAEDDDEGDVHIQATDLEVRVLTQFG